MTLEKEILEMKLSQNKVMNIVCKQLSEICLILGKQTKSEQQQIKFDEQAIIFDKLSEFYKRRDNKC